MRLPLRIRLVLLVGLAACCALLVGGPVAAATGEEGAVVVVDVHGPLDQRALDFITDVVEREPGQLVVIQVDNPGVASGDPGELYAAIDASPRPVAVWVGPSGAEAYGGAASLVELAAFSGAAPGASVGYLDPTVAGGEGMKAVPGVDRALLDDRLVDSSVLVTPSTEGVVDVVVPTIGQFIAAMDGLSLDTVDGAKVVDTTEETTADDGTVLVVPATEVRFLKPGLVTRFLRLAMRPEATFFFLTIGLAAAAFEFYAAGIGITAAVASLALFLGGFGVASLPVRWWSLAAVGVGMVLYTVDFQNSTISWRGLLGSVLLLVGGLTLTDAGPQFGPEWWVVVLVVIGIAAFYMVALTTVARARFSTRTIGRDHLVGKRGVAETDMDPQGVVEVDGARWRARSHRAAGVAAGDAVEVVGVAGIMLEVEPPGEGSRDLRE